MTSKTFGNCAGCGARFVHADRPGRRRSYCHESCRRRSQRLKHGSSDTASSRPAPLARPIAEDLQQVVNQLLQAEYDGDSLRSRLAAVRRIADELESYEAAAVADARLRDGATWKEVADAAQCPPVTARNRWRPAEVQRKLERRSAARRGGKTPGQTRSAPPVMPRRAAAPALATAGRRPARLLAQALSYLQRLSRKTISALAREIGVSPSYISRLLSGDRLPSWPVTCRLVESCGGDPVELRAMWESARGIRVPEQTPAEAAPVFEAALRGLYLAAGQPAPERLRALTRGALSAETIRDLLEGRRLADWDVVGRLVTVLQGQPADLRPLWDAAASSHRRPRLARATVQTQQSRYPAASFG
jgi:transcriptional regulator with XRE-family HTH domain